MAQKLVKFITEQECMALFRRENDWDVRVALLLGWGSGLRISEIVGLRKEISKCCKADVKTERVRTEDGRRKVKSCSVCGARLNTRDIGRSRTEWAIPPLTRDRVNLEEHTIRVIAGKGEKDRVTVTPYKYLKESRLKRLPLTMSRRWLQKRVTQLGKEVLGKHITFHYLRHGFGNHHANVLKTPLPIVQQMIGHSSISTTGIYTKSNPRQAIAIAWEAMTGGNV